MRRTRRTGRGGGGGKRGRGGEEEEEEVRKRKTTTRMTKMMTVSVIQSTKLQIAFILVSWLRLHFLSNVIPQTLNNEVLAETVLLKNIFVKTLSANKEKNLSSDFNYSRYLFHN